MNVLLATDITSAMLVSSNAPVRVDGQAEWDAIAYPAGATVTRASTRRVYKSAYAVPVDFLPPEEDIVVSQLPYWVDAGPMNQWGMFDGQVRTQTVGPEGDLIVVLAPGVVTDLWIGNLANATSVHVVIRDKPGGVIIYNEYRELFRPVTTFWDWWFAPFVLAGDATFTGIPAYRNCEITITVSAGAGGNASVGMVAVGKVENLGYTEYDAEVTLRNYAARQLDQRWGPTEGTGGIVTRDPTFTIVIEPEDAPRVTRFMETAMRRPGVWIPNGDPEYEGIRGFGQAVDARISYPNHGEVLLFLTIRGFI